MRQLLDRIVSLSLVVFFSIGIVQGQANKQNLTTRYFHEIDTLLSNPGKGWMLFQPFPGSAGRFPTSVAYWRFDWNDLQPAPTTYNWAILDSLVGACKAKGIKCSFRVMTANANSRGYYCSPKWLFDEGCRSFEYGGSGDAVQGGDKVKRLEPDYSDAIFLSTHGKFITELGKRYDGNPDIGFVDIGSYGVWGEWHTPHPVDLATRTKIVDMYVNAFTQTPLVMMTADSAALLYAISRGAGIRRDGIGSVWDIQSWTKSVAYTGSPVNEVWKKAPVVFEWYANYEYLSKCDHCSFNAGFQFMLDNHVTYINDNLGPIADSIYSRLHTLGEKSGYRFVLKDISHPSTVNPGGSVDVHMTWQNTGVAPIYKSYRIQLFLIDSLQNVIVTKQLDLDLRTWLPGAHSSGTTMEIPETLNVGKYTIGVAIVDSITKKPAIRFPINAIEKGSIYYVSEVSISALKK
jgi:hypothetical protein